MKRRFLQKRRRESPSLLGGGTRRLIPFHFKVDTIGSWGSWGSWEKEFVSRIREMVLVISIIKH
ncbi:MAG: hypothetical protein HC773_32615 [Scytonema sp. CRU_2_7]|nr:hypothetical protein [Scytonema sp. CRU_2_7]